MPPAIVRHCDIGNGLTARLEKDGGLSFLREGLVVFGVGPREAATARTFLNHVIPERVPFQADFRLQPRPGPNGSLRPCDCDGNDMAGHMPDCPGNGDGPVPPLPGPACVVCHLQPEPGKPERDQWVGLRLGTNSVFTHTDKRGNDTGARSCMVTFAHGGQCYAYAHAACLPAALRPARKEVP